MYRCHVCEPEANQLGTDFEANKPICPRCGTDGTNARFQKYITERVVLHFDAPTHIPDLGVGYIACNPSQRVPAGAHLRFTGDPGAVSCPACRATEAWVKASAKGVTGKIGNLLNTGG